MAVQDEVVVHFAVMLVCASMFATGIGIYIYEFIQFGRPTDEALEKSGNDSIDDRPLNGEPLDEPYEKELVAG